MRIAKNQGNHNKGDQVIMANDKSIIDQDSLHSDWLVVWHRNSKQNPNNKQIDGKQNLGPSNSKTRKTGKYPLNRSTRPPI